MGSKRVDLSNFDYKKFEPQVRPSTKRLSNYRSMPHELIVDESGYVKNPFNENDNRFVCFEALRRKISLD